MTTPIDLALATRTGIPDTLAHLRAAYPSSEWRANAAFGDLAGFWLHVHDSLRAEAGAVSGLLGAARTGGIDPGDLPRRFVPAFNAFLQHLDAHHRIEDAAYFPKFRALDPRMGAGFDLLEADHHAIDSTLHATLASARSMLATLAQPGADPRSAIERHADDADLLSALMMRHLADEEDIVIPAMLEHGERALR